MINKTSSEDAVKKRMRHWALCYSGGHSDLGYPDKDTVKRAQECGGVVIRGTGSKPIPIDSDAEEVETLLKVYSREHFKEAEVLRTHFLFPDNTTVVRARHLNLSQSRYFTLLAKALSWMEGRLSVSK